MAEPANVEEALADLAYAATSIASSITPSVLPGTDATGGTVASLTEAVMGITAGLVQVAEAIDRLAEAVHRMER